MSGKGDAGFHRGHRTRYVSAQQDHLGMLLRQLGAEVREIHGLICFVRFDLNGTELFYVYNLNDDDEYYLQRVKPYPMSAGVFPTVADIVAYIEKDLRAFQNAMKSGQYAAFMELGQRLTALTQGLEDAFLHCGVPGACFDEACAEAEKIEKLLHGMKESAKPLE